MNRSIRLLVVAVIVCIGCLLSRLSIRSTPPAPLGASDYGSAAQPVAITCSRDSSERESRVAVATLSGSVLVAGEGTPVSGTEVRVEGESFRSVTDSRGRFETGALHPGDVVVRVDADYPLTSISQTVPLTAGVNEIALELEPSYVLAVRLRDGSTDAAKQGDPIAGARVRLGPPSLGKSRDRAMTERSSLTDARGECELAGIPDGDHELRVEAAGYLPIVIELPFRYAERRKRPHLRDREITLQTIERGEVVRGRVLDRSGEPIPGALVCLDTRGSRNRAFRREPAGLAPAPQHTLTDGVGAFSMEAPARQASLSLLVCPNRARLAPIVRQEVRATGSQREQIVRVPPAIPMSLRFSRKDGSAVPGRVDVADGSIAYDLASDPLLMGIPGFAQSFLPRCESEGLTVDLPEGGYTVLFRPAVAELRPKAFYVRVTDDGPHEIDLQLDV